MISRVLVAADGSPSSVAASRYAAHFARQRQCHVTVLHVLEEPSFPMFVDQMSEQERKQLHLRLEEAGRAILRLNQQPLAEAGVAAEVATRHGRAPDIICEVAREGRYDLIVIGSASRSGLGRVLLGSVSQEVVRNAPCSVLVARVSG